MTTQDPGSGRRGHLGGVGVAVVLALAGVMFTSSARLAGGSDDRGTPADLRDLVEQESNRMDSLSSHVEDLTGEIERLSAAASPPGRDARAVALRDFGAGSVPVSGEGLTVRLNDAPADAPRPAQVSLDDLLVHQQDLQAVLNALWAGGAEAISVQDQRIVATSAVRCIGNVLFLHGRRYSPPYVIEAIGDPDRLKSALYADAGVQVYLQYVDAVGLGWSVARQDRLDLSAYEETLQYARVPSGAPATPTAAGATPAADRRGAGR